MNRQRELVEGVGINLDGSVVYDCHEFVNCEFSLYKCKRVCLIDSVLINCFIRDKEGQHIIENEEMLNRYGAVRNCQIYYINDY